MRILLCLGGGDASSLPPDTQKPQMPLYSAPGTNTLPTGGMGPSAPIQGFTSANITPQSQAMPQTQAQAPTLGQASTPNFLQQLLARHRGLQGLIGGGNQGPTTNQQ